MLLKNEKQIKHWQWLLNCQIYCSEYSADSVMCNSDEKVWKPNIIDWGVMKVCCSFIILSEEGALSLHWIPQPSVFQLTGEQVSSIPLFPFTVNIFIKMQELTALYVSSFPSMQPNAKVCTPLIQYHEPNEI